MAFHKFHGQEYQLGGDPSYLGEDTNDCREYASAHRRLQLESDPPFQNITTILTGEKGTTAITEPRIAEYPLYKAHKYCASSPNADAATVTNLSLQFEYSGCGSLGHKFPTAGRESMKCAWRGGHFSWDLILGAE
jgi:hypothetical protein